MKVNKNTSIACISAIIISGIALVLITLYVPRFSGYASKHYARSANGNDDFIPFHNT